MLKTATQLSATSVSDNGCELSAALARCKTAFLGIGLFSCLINLLMLTGPLFMLQVYDRVLPSRSIPTLVALALLAGTLYLFQGILDSIRGRLLRRVGGSLDASLSTRVYDAVIQLPLRVRGQGDGLQPIRDLDQQRGFIGGAGPSAMFDLPWTPFYVAVCYLFHPWIGIAAAAGAGILFSFAVAMEFVTREPARTSTQLASSRLALATASRRNAEALQALGMGQRFADRWMETNRNYRNSHARAADISGALSSASRVIRMLLQSTVLGLGAFLVIEQELTAGVIIAASVLVSRAVAPIEQTIGNWRGFVAARQSWARLRELLSLLPAEKERIALRPPTARLDVQNASAAPPGDRRIILRDIDLSLEAGAGLGVIGPSAAGKSSLARLLVGVWSPARGHVRLDGSSLDQWPRDWLGPHIGYLPQDVELFDGTVAQNIARFDTQATSDAILTAAIAADVHELVLTLPDGYETRIGESGACLSAGQRQRIGLARALYGDPFLVVLDEPNSNLDTEGELALVHAILGVRERGGIAVVMAHRPAVLSAVDKVLVLTNGRQQAFGPREDILRSILRPGPVASAPAAAPREVRA
jgi:ATP-binding cassette, subfamily C, type I secretion system permease/ATPase